MKSLLGKLGVILIGLIIFGYAEACRAEDEARYNCNKIQTEMTQNEVMKVSDFRVIENQNLLLIRGKLSIRGDLLEVPFLRCLIV